MVDHHHEELLESIMGRDTLSYSLFVSLEPPREPWGHPLFLGVQDHPNRMFFDPQDHSH